MLCLHKHAVSLSFLTFLTFLNFLTFLTFIIRIIINSHNDLIFADFVVQLLNLDCVLQKLLYVVVNIQV